MPILNTPFLDQWAIASADWYRADCGVACVAMLLEQYGKRNGWTVNQLAVQTPLKDGAQGLMPQHLVSLAALHGLPTSTAVLTLNQVRYEIDAGRPVILLIAYRYITGRLDQADNVPGSDGHFVVVVGYDDSHFVLNDPDYWVPYTERGHDYLCPVNDLDKAMSIYNNQAVIVRTDCMSVQDQIIAQAKQIEMAAQQIETLAGLIETTPVPTPTPTTDYCLIQKLNVRSTPATTGAAVGWLISGDSVQTLPDLADPTYTWVRIVGGKIRTAAGQVDVANIAQTLYACAQNGSENYLGTTRP
jgi:hypothetical protein